MGMTFEQAVAHLKTLGVEFTQDYDYGKRGTEERHRFDVPIIRNVRLPFSAEEWCSLCMSEGEHYIGPCCGTTSAAQDVLNYAFRFGGGWMDTGKYAEMADLLANHDPISGPFSFDKRPRSVPKAVAQASSEWASMGPWSKMAIIWHVVREFADVNPPRAAFPKRQSDLDAALHVAEASLRTLSYERLFGSFENARPRTSQDKAKRAFGLAKLIPAIRIIQGKIAELYEGPVDGYALIDKEEGPESITSNGLGLCVYATREEVDEVLEIWRAQEKEYEERRKRTKPVDERIGVRRVRVTMEKGLEFLD